MKAWNVISIIFAWIISIALVLALVATPVVMSALSLLNPKTLTDVLTETLIGDQKKSASEEIDGAQIALLASDSDTAAKNESVDALITPEMVKDLLGVEVDKEGLEEVVKSKPMQKVLSAYTEDLTNVITGSGETKFDGNAIKKIVDENLEEIVDVLQEVSPELAEKSKEELRDQIRTTVEDKADAFVQELPKAEEVKEDLVEEIPAAETVFSVLAKKTALKWGIIGGLVLLAVIIFFLRYPGFRGLRWLAVDLFVASGIGALLCVALKVVSPMMAQLMEDGPAAVTTLVNSVLSVLTNGLIWRFAVMLGSGVVLLVGYILIKKFRKESVVVEEAAEEVLVEETADAPVAEAVEAADEAAEEAETAEEPETV